MEDNLFTGRERERRFFVSMLEGREPTRVLVITGMGGIGKTEILKQFQGLADERQVPWALIDGIIAEDVSFTRNPDLVMKPEYALPILFVGMNEGWFTGRKLSDYFGGTEADPKNARRIINGTDKADEIAGLYRQYVRALLLSEVKSDGEPAIVTENPLVAEGIKAIIVALEKLSPFAVANKARIEKALAALS